MCPQIGPLGTNFSDISIEICTFSFKEMFSKISSAKWRPFFLSLNVLIHWGWDKMATILQNYIFKCIFLDKNRSISLMLSLQFLPMVQITSIPALVQIMTWRRSGAKSLSETLMVGLLTLIFVTRLQWVKYTYSVLVQNDLRCKHVISIHPHDLKPYIGEIY